LGKLTNIFAPTHYNLQDFIMLFCLGLVMIGIFYPILYFFKNSYLAMGVIFVLIVAGTFFTIESLANILGMTKDIRINGIDRGFALLAETYFPFQPYVIAVILSAALFLGSLKLSGWIMEIKNF